jgi:hypothetical protein
MQQQGAENKNGKKHYDINRVLPEVLYNQQHQDIVFFNFVSEQ